ncbi:glycosyltransferase family 4 protein [bacterium]|nr:glycosyltransferase family 4 protein [bacterium]
MNQSIFKIAISAAHGGSNSNLIPLGGGAAVCERLLQAWSDLPNLEIDLIAPGKASPIQNGGLEHREKDAPGYESEIISCSSPGHSRATVRIIRVPVLKEGENPSSLSTLRYAKFCRQFEKASTSVILELKPDIVLTHDISEGPDFRALQAARIPCVPIFHVDVNDFFCRMYLKNYLTAKQGEHWFAKVRHLPIVPDLLRLVFDKQFYAVKTCPKLIVPSAGMKTILTETYPKFKSLSSRLEVIPWGSPEPDFSEEEISDAKRQINEEFNLSADTPVIVMLSRISPEKAQNKMIDALLWGEQFGEIPHNLTLMICGDASFMQGKKFYKKLKAKAAKLHSARVIFPGHVGGLKKAAILSRADIFVSTSYHESYGLTTMEAMLEGTPAIALDTPGARQTIKPNTGLIIDSAEPNVPQLWKAVYSVLKNPEYKERMSLAASEYAREETFAKAAEHILNLLYTCRAEYKA